MHYKSIFALMRYKFVRNSVLELKTTKFYLFISLLEISILRIVLHSRSLTSYQFFTIPLSVNMELIVFTTNFE